MKQMIATTLGRTCRAQVWPDKTMPSQADGEPFVWACLMGEFGWGYAGWYPARIFTEAA